MFKKLLSLMLLLCALVVGSGTAWADDPVTLVSGSGTSGYAVPDGWSTSGTVEGGSYLKIDNGTMTSSSFAPHNSLSFTYSVATFGSGTNHPLTIRILNASTDAVIVEETTATPTSSSYISTNSPIDLGDIDVDFKIQLYAPTGRGIRLRNYSVTGIPASGDDPSISADPTTLNPFTYVEGSGPSAAQAISVSGSNLTDPITLNLGNNSNYEVSTTQNNGYSSSLSLSPTNNAVSATNVYVRLKAELAKGTRNGTLTISTDGADDINVSLSGSVTGQTYAVTVATGLTGGTIEADPTNAAEGATISLTANPEDAYTFGSWSVYKTGDQSTTVTVENNQFTMPDYAVTVSATFTAKPTHTATFNVNGAPSSNTFYVGQTISFPADPADISGKTFIGWLKNSTISGTTNEAPSTVDKSNETMGNSNVTYYAVFAEITGTTEASWTETAIGSVSSSDVIVISDGSYAMNNDGGTSNAPTANSISVSGTSLTAEPNNNLKWNVSGNATDGYTFYPNGTTSTWLYCSTTASSSSNNNIRVGTGDRKVWKFDNSGYLVTKDNYTARYLSIYNNSDFRGYTGTGNGAFVPKFYKYTEGSATYGNYCTTVVVTYSVTYDGNDATSGSVPEDNTAYTSGQSVTVAGNTGNLAKTGYAFGGWNTQNDGQGTNYAANETFSITANTTLYAKWNAKTITGLSYTGTPTKTTYSAGESFDPTGLTVTATYNDASQEDVTASVTWTPDPLTVGTTSVTGTYQGQTVNVSGLTVTAAAGSADNPYTVAQALAASASNGVYVHGIVSRVYSTSLTNNGQIRYYISDDGTTSNEMNIYNGLGINGAAFTSIDDIQEGDEVVVTGDISVYQNANQLNANNQLVSLKLVAPTFSVAAGAVTSGTTVTIADLHTDATIYYTTDGTDPTNESSVYSAPISITSATTLKAIAVKSGYTTSDIASAAYTISVIPVITVTADDPVNVTAASGSGELALTYDNLTISQASDFAVQFYDANDNELSSQNEPNWISVAVEAANPSGYKVSYTVDANTVTSARSAYFKVWALDDNTDPVYSNKVTITQAAKAITAPTIELASGLYSTTQSVTITTNEAGGTTYYTTDGTDPTDASDEYTGAISITATTTLKAITYVGEDYSSIASETYTIFAVEDGVFDFVEAGAAGYDYGSGVEKTNSSSTYVTTSKTWTVGNVTMVTDRESGNGYRWWSNDNTLRFYSGSNATFSVPSGYAITTIVTTGANFDSADKGNLSSNTWTGLESEVKLSATGGRNIKTITVTYAPTATITISSACTDGEGNYYATYSNTSAFVVPEGVTVSEITLNGNALVLEDYATGAIVPANTGVIVSSTTAGDKTVVLSNEAGTSVLGSDNALRPTGDGIDAAAMSAADANSLYYRLTMHNGTALGFWWGAENGAAFAVNANKAYLVAPNGTGVKGFNFFDNETAIKQVSGETEAAQATFNLMGQRVNANTRGIVIRNGKKFINK